MKEVTEKLNAAAEVVFKSDEVRRAVKRQLPGRMMTAAQNGMTAA